VVVGTLKLNLKWASKTKKWLNKGDLRKTTSEDIG